MLGLEDTIRNLEIMIEADTGHLNKAVKRGDRVLAHQFVDSIVDRTRELEDLKTGVVR